MKHDITEFNFRTGTHSYKDGQIWEECDGPTSLGWFRNDKGRKVSIKSMGTVKMQEMAAIALCPALKEKRIPGRGARIFFGWGRQQMHNPEYFEWLHESMKKVGLSLEDIAAIKDLSKWEGVEEYARTGVFDL